MMRIKLLIYIAITLIASLFCVPAHSQEHGNFAYREKSDSLTIYFPLNQYVFDPSYMGNQASVDRFLELKDKQTIVCKVTSSPEGERGRNSFLSCKRAEAIAKYINSNYEIGSGTLEISVTDEAWEELESMIRESDMSWKSDVLQIFEENPVSVTDENGRNIEKRKNVLRGYDNGTVWEWMKANWFPQLRQTFIIIKTSQKIQLIEKIEPLVAEIVFEAPQPAAIKYEPTPGVRPWSPKLYIKTNIIGWGMGHANIAVETDFAPHWSISIPFYYSGGFDYFKETLKFRGIVVQPEVRYYINMNEGFFIGAHAGLGWYNFALDGEFRIQDHKGHTPAYGGGVSLGYKMPFRKHPNWGMEFVLGAGVYKAKYDIFYNEHNGPYEDTAVEKVFFGLDNVSVAFTYNFNIRKEGRK